MRRAIASSRILALPAFALMALLAVSCGASVELAIGAGGSASIGLGVEVPPAVEARIRRFTASAGAAASAPLFDAAAVSGAVRARGATVDSSRAPTTGSYRGSFRAADLTALIAGTEGLGAALDYRRAPGRASLAFRLDRTTAPALVGLFPGIDAELLESLQPPALYDNPVSIAEYRSMLAGLLGQAALSVIDGQALELRVTLPGPVLELSGAAKAAPGGRSVSISVPALEAMVLAEPVAFCVEWSE